jgi:prolipoprotein diacylglyceryltransferase
MTLNIGQKLSIPFVVCGIILLIYSLKKQPEIEPPFVIDKKKNSKLN